MDTDPVLEGLMSQLGDFGKYQFRQHILHILSAFLAGIHMLSLTMVAPTPVHRCYVPVLDAGVKEKTFNESILSYYFKPKKNGDIDYCHWTDPTTNDSRGCNESYVYDTTQYKTSKVMQWDLVCDERWERAIIQTIYMFGVLIGAIVLGSLADKHGRKTIFYISGICQLIAGLTVAFVPNFIAYCCCLFFYGMFGSGGAYVTGFVLTMELVGPSKRTLCGTAFSGAFAIGVMVNSFWGYMIPNVTILQCVYALHSLLLVGHWWLVDESIRWLWGQGKIKEAITIVEKGVRINTGSNQNFDSSQFQVAKVENNGASSSKNQEDGQTISYGAGDLFKTPRIRRRALNVAFCWFANSLVYYGLSLNSGSLQGNPYLNLFLIGVAEVPGYITVILLVDRTGRRPLLTALLTMGGIACIIVAFMGKGLPATIIVMIAKMGVAGSFAITYNYTAELFPTVIRNSAIGFGACSARFSGMLTPLIGLLDSIGNQVPSLVFGCVAVTAASLALFLPETLHKEMPQTIQDGEHFGKGDSGYKTLGRLLCWVCGRKGGRNGSGDGQESDNPETAGFLQNSSGSSNSPNSA